MIIRNYLFTFGGALILLTTGHLLVFYKYFQVLIHRTLYYCQALANALNFQLPTTYGKVIAGILVIAALFTLFRLTRSVVNIFAFRKALLKKIDEDSDDVANLCTSLDLQGKVIIFTVAKPLAFCFGIHSPKIYLSTGIIQLMSQSELKVILKHEKYHLEHKDTLALLLASLIESLFPFFPVVSDLIRVYRTDREVAADKAAITNAADKQSLKDILKKLIQYNPDTHPAYLPAMMSLDTLETRIRSINLIDTRHKKIGLVNLGLSFASLIILLGLIVTPVNVIELHAGGQDAVILCS